MKSTLLLIISLLAGCGLMLTDTAPAITEDGSRIYSITSMYDGETGSRDRASAAMIIDATNLCRSGFTRLSEESRPIMNGIGEVTSTRLIWEIKCDIKPAEASQ
ncbi:MAG: hypothetical protein ABI167_10970 [Nitrosospira sp.]